MVHINLAQYQWLKSMVKINLANSQWFTEFCLPLGFTEKVKSQWLRNLAKYQRFTETEVSSSDFISSFTSWDIE